MQERLGIGDSHRELSLQAGQHRSWGGHEEGGLTLGRHIGSCCDVTVVEWAGLGG